MRRHRGTQNPCKDFLASKRKYGITLENEEHIDAVKESIELIKSYRREDFQPMWDYGGEDPFRDERGLPGEDALQSSR